MVRPESHARGEHVIHASTMATRAVLASAIIHVSVAVAVVAGSRGGKKGGGQDVTIDVDRADPVASPDTMLEELRPDVTPDAPARVANVVAKAAASPSHPRAAALPHPAEEGAPPSVVTAPTSAPPRFVMAFGTEATATEGQSRAGPGTTGESGDATETYPENGVSSRARLLEGAPPEYPPAARAAAVEADLPLEIVVNASGAVVDARLLRHAGYGLDEAALRAIRAYRFAPAQRAGRGVSVRMRWVVDFRLD
jgi:periplasmic protein TonB